MKKIRQALHREHGQPNVAPTEPGLQQPFYPPGTLPPGTVQGGPAMATTGLATGYAAPSTVVEHERTITEETMRPREIIEERIIREEIIRPQPRTEIIEERITREEIVEAPRVITSEPVYEHREKAPVVQEVVKPGVREEIQPVIHRDREQLEIREEIQPIYEKTVRPTLVEERQLAPETRAEVRTGVMPVIAEGPRSNVVVEREHVEVMTKAPIVEETVHRKIIEEVQPVIHRETIAPRVIKEIQPIYEKVVEAPVVTYTTLAPRYQSGTETTAWVERPREIIEERVTTTVVEKEFLPGTSRPPITTPLSTQPMGPGAVCYTTTGTTAAPTTTYGATTRGTTTQPYSTTSTSAAPLPTSTYSSTTTSAAPLPQSQYTSQQQYTTTTTQPQQYTTQPQQFTSSQPQQFTSSQPYVSSTSQQYSPPGSTTQQPGGVQGLTQVFQEGMKMEEQRGLGGQQPPSTFQYK